MMMEATSEMVEECPQLLQPSTIEKRKHGEIGDGSLQSTQSPPLPLPEKRTCVQIVEKPAESLPTSQKRNLLEDIKQPVFADLPPSEQKLFQSSRDKFGPSWPRCHMENILRDSASEQLGENPYMAEWKQSLIDQGRAVKNYTSCCSNPFKPMDFKPESDLYKDLRAFAEKAVADYNRKMMNTTNFCFQDFESVTSCFSSCNHCKVAIIAVDPCAKITIRIALRGIVDAGFAEAKVEEFVLLSACKIKNERSEMIVDSASGQPLVT